jgi:hypothetical protein
MASWAGGLREQCAAVHELHFRRFHRNEWTSRIGSWLAAGAWQACANGARFTDGEPIWAAVDVGGARAHTAVVWLNRELNVGSDLRGRGRGLRRARKNPAAGRALRAP